ncbi:MAG: prepilin-type N-terminal cleavage/methylation domain-containing protein [Phycisphaerales bacterium]|nr:prepilin-type N-terminal cleavage/methylation domain-containing protein [Phycisphaerales bacterium]
MIMVNRHFRSACGPRVPAFTLVELLVVVSIIALLVAVLLPSLRKAREGAKRVACNANMRSLAQAALTYAGEDPQENIVPIGLGDATRPELIYSYYGFGGKSGKGRNDLPTVENLRQSEWSGRYQMDAAMRPLNAIFYPGGLSTPGAPRFVADWTKDYDLELDVYRCPGDKRFPGFHYAGWKAVDGSSYDYFGTSYAANPSYVGIPGRAEVQTNSMYARPLSRVPNPTNTVLFWENAARFAFYAPNTQEYDQSGCYWDSGLHKTAREEDFIAHGFHGQDWHFNVSFGDGHSTWIKIKGHGHDYSLEQKLPKLVSPMCNPYIMGGSSCECIVVRGLGWQADTLPAAPLVTEKTRQEVSSYGPLSGGGILDYEVVK